LHGGAAAVVHRAERFAPRAITSFLPAAITLVPGRRQTPFLFPTGETPAMPGLAP
jgi:hypothetical protein